MTSNAKANHPCPVFLRLTPDMASISNYTPFRAPQYPESQIRTGSISGHSIKRDGRMTPDAPNISFRDEAGLGTLHIMPLHDGFSEWQVINYLQSLPVTTPIGEREQSFFENPLAPIFGLASPSESVLLGAMGAWVSNDPSQELPRLGHHFFHLHVRRSDPGAARFMHPAEVAACVERLTRSCPQLDGQPA